jgi:hypothetical protein
MNSSITLYFFYAIAIAAPRGVSTNGRLINRFNNNNNNNNNATDSSQTAN